MPTFGDFDTANPDALLESARQRLEIQEDVLAIPGSVLADAVGQQVGSQEQDLMRVVRPLVSAVGEMVDLQQEDLQKVVGPIVAVVGGLIGAQEAMLGQLPEEAFEEGPGDATGAAVSPLAEAELLHVPPPGALPRPPEGTPFTVDRPGWYYIWSHLNIARGFAFFPPAIYDAHFLFLIDGPFPTAEALVARHPSVIPFSVGPIESRFLPTPQPVSLPAAVTPPQPAPDGGSPGEVTQPPAPLSTIPFEPLPEEPPEETLELIPPPRPEPEPTTPTCPDVIVEPCPAAPPTQTAPMPAGGEERSRGGVGEVCPVAIDAPGPDDPIVVAAACAPELIAVGGPVAVGQMNMVAWSQSKASDRWGLDLDRLSPQVARTFPDPMSVERLVKEKRFL